MGASGGQRGPITSLWALLDKPAMVVPEPGSDALLLPARGALGCVAKRRKAA